MSNAVILNSPEAVMALLSGERIRCIIWPVHRYIMRNILTNQMIDEAGRVIPAEDYLDYLNSVSAWEVYRAVPLPVEHEPVYLTGWEDLWELT